jgi:hypothetical protein
MQPEHNHKGRTQLVAITLIALALQAIKLVSRGVLLQKWPAGGQWGQLCLVLWLLFCLWEGKEWARVVSGVFYTLGSIVAVVVLIIMWSGAPASLRVVSILTLVLTSWVSFVLWFSDDLSIYLAERRAASASGA